jgi:hypothetical protein
MAEFAYNIIVYLALGVSLFFAETGRNPRADDMARPLSKSRLVPNTPAALDWVQKLLEYRDYLSERLREAAAARRRYASGRTKPHEFAVGDKV